MGRYGPYVAVVVILAVAGAGAYFFLLRPGPPPERAAPSGLLELHVASRGLKAKPVALEVLFDGSGSMRAVHPATGRRKIDEAKEALRRFMERAPEGLRLGLRVFGTSTPNTEPYKARGCRDTRQLIPIGQGTAKEVVRAVEAIQASGWTPLAYSMKKVLEDFRAVEGPRRLVVITDGRERCQAFDGNPAEAVRALKDAGVGVTVAFIGHDTPPEIRRALEELTLAGGAEVLELAAPRELRELLAEVAEAVELTATARNQATGRTFQVATARPARLPPGTYTLEISAKEGLSPKPTRLSDITVQAGRTTRLDVLFVEGEAQVEVSTR